jgi:hypothetical protein
LSLWAHLVKHHDVLEAEIKAAGVRWTEKAKAYAGLGLTNADGALPSPACVRQTWSRVRRTVRRERQDPRAIVRRALKTAEDGSPAERVAAVREVARLAGIEV